MIQGEWNSLTSATAAAFTALVFLHAVWHKLSDFAFFTGIVEDYRIVPAWAAPGVSRGVIAAEALAALALAVPGLRGFGARLAIAMLLVYTAAMTANLVRGRRRLECGCGGAPQMLGWPLVVRNMALAGVGALALASDGPAPSGGGLLVSIVGGFTLWIGFLLVEQILANASRVGLGSQDGIS